MGAGAGIGLLMNVKNAITNVFTDINTKITASRAAGLDNLPNIGSGPVALQSNLGTVADTTGMNTTLSAALNLIFQQVWGMDGQLRQIVSGQQTIYTGIGSTTAIFMGTGQKVVPLNMNNGVISWDASTYGSPITSVKVFSPSVPQLHLIPSISGGANVATTLQIVGNGQQPSAVGTLFKLVDVNGTSNALTWAWNGSSYVLTSNNGASNTVNTIPAGPYPITFRWSPTGLTWTTNAGVHGTIAQVALPNVTLAYNLVLYANSGIQVVALGYT